MDLSTQRASMSAPWSRPWKHDVFLSFRGETRNGFTDHLFTALQELGIKVFRDREIQIGANIFLELWTAIEESRFAIVVISTDFASSTWCLDELTKMFDCMEGRNAMLPIFYGVDPSDVRKQTGTLAEAFIEHEKKQDRATLHRWRTALTKVAGLRGWTLIENRSEADFIQEIVHSVWGKLVAHAYCNVQLTNPQTTGLAETYSYLAPNSVSTGGVVASGFAPANNNVSQARNLCQLCEAAQLMLPDPNHVPISTPQMVINSPMNEDRCESGAGSRRSCYDNPGLDLYTSKRKRVFNWLGRRGRDCKMMYRSIIT